MSITPKNWSSFQHYKDRAPSWIKLHHGLLDDFTFSRLPIASRALAPLLWLLASEYEEGKITASNEEVAFRLRMSESELNSALSPLIDSGFFIASEPLAECKQSACLEKEIEKEIEVEKIAARAPTKPAVEKKSRAKPKVSIAEGFLFSQRTRDYAVKLGFSSPEIDREHQRFTRHAKQNDRRCADWDAAADNWFDKAAEFAGKRAPIDPAVAAEALKGKFYAAAESRQLEAWDQYSISLRGVRMMRDRNNGWLVDSEWPPGYVPSQPNSQPPPNMQRPQTFN